MLASLLVNAITLSFVSATTFDVAAMLDAVNQVRMQAGVAPLCYSSKLMSVAQKHSDYQASINTMTHNGLVSFSQRFLDEGFQFSRIGENVARMNTNKVSDVMAAWINSPGHRANILGDYTHFGAGLAVRGAAFYWTQDFGKPRFSNEPCMQIPPLPSTTTSTVRPTVTTPVSTLNPPAMTCMCPRPQKNQGSPTGVPVNTQDHPSNSSDDRPQLLPEPLIYTTEIRDNQ